MNIGQASRASRISAKMIRYYEQIGLLPPADRSDAGYRTYGRADIQRLHFIRRARDFGFASSEIRELLDLQCDHSRRSADVKRLAEQHIAALQRRIADMRQMESSLQALAGACAGDHRPECPILQGLQQSDDCEGAAVPRRPGAVAHPGLACAQGKARTCGCPH